MEPKAVDKGIARLKIIDILKFISGLFIFKGCLSKSNSIVLRVDDPNIRQYVILVLSDKE